MKKTLLALVMASLLPAAAFADVTVYGKANVALQNADEEATGSKIELVSNASRIGLKGGEEVNSSLKVIYQFEYQTEVDDGTNGSQTFGQRNIYVGLQGTAGTIMAGNFDTPTKVAQEKVDLFNDLEGDINQIFNGEIRAKNIVQYVTPASWGAFTSSVAYVTKETDGVDDGVSVSVAYNTPVVYVAVAVDQDVEAEGVDLVRVVGRFTIGAFQLGLLGETYDNGIVDEDGAFVSALWNLNDKWALKTQYGQSEVKMADGESASIGADYKMTKAATLYGYVTKVENDVLTPSAKRDDTYVGVGMDFKF
jgi:predicted porin